MAETETLENIAELRWDRRVLLVFSEPSAAADLESQLRQHTAGFAERDTSWFLVIEADRIISNHEVPLAEGLAARWRGYFAPISIPVDVLLVGKDGGRKLRTQKLSVEQLFSRIDGMPMRRFEIEQKVKQAAAISLLDGSNATLFDKKKYK